MATDGPHVSPNYSKRGIPFLSTRHIKPGEIIWEDLKFIDEAEANRQWAKCKPELGDILYTKGGTTGIAACVRTSQEFAIWVHIALLKPILRKVNPLWMESMLNSAYCYTQSQRYTHGIANRDLGLKRMVNIKIYLPSLKEQHHFATIVESVEKQKARMRTHLAELDALFASLQARAFNGEL
jgi:type I restriction enzyme S subunit